MTERCLSEWELFSVAEGDGSPAQTAHLGHCDQCRIRADAQQRQVSDIAAVLRTAPLPPSPEFAPVPSLRWLAPAAAALLTAFLVHSWMPTTRNPATAPPFLSDVSTVLFTTEDRTWRFEDDRDEMLIRAALRGEAPCELQHGVDTLGCY